MRNHVGEGFGGGWCKQSVEKLLDVFDESFGDVIVDLDGDWREDILNQRLDQFKAAAPERFVIFGGADWSLWFLYRGVSGCSLQLLD